MATVSVELGAAYCTLFTDDVAPEVNLDTLHHVTAYSKLLLNSYEEKSNILLQISIFRVLFDRHCKNQVQPSNSLIPRKKRAKVSTSPITTTSSSCDGSIGHSADGVGHNIVSPVATKCVTFANELLKVDLCKTLVDKSDLVVQQLVGYLASSDQFVSYSASKSLASFLLHISNISPVMVELLSQVDHLNLLKTCQSHVAVYTLQMFTDVLKSVRKNCVGVQAIKTDAVWEVVASVLKQSLKVFDMVVKELCLQEPAEKDEGRRSLDEQGMKWVELTLDVFLSLSIETLRHHRTNNTSDCFVSCELIYNSLFQFTSFLEGTKSLYLLKQIVALHLKILNNSSLFEHFDLLSIHHSLTKLFQSNLFTNAAESWLGTTSGPSSQANIAETTNSTSPHSCTETNEWGLTLESCIIGTIMRKGVLLLLNYSALVLADGDKNSEQTRSTVFVHLEELLSLMAAKFHQKDVTSPPLDPLGLARHRLLEMLSEQDSCLLEGLLLSYSITITVRDSSSSQYIRDHPTLCTCLEIINIHRLFVKFLSSLIFFDHSLLIDYVMSPETASIFRQFLYQYLTLAVKEWTSVIQACEELDSHSKDLLSSEEYSSESDTEKNPKLGILECASYNEDSPKSSCDEGWTNPKRPKLDRESVLGSSSYTESNINTTYPGSCAVVKDRVDTLDPDAGVSEVSIATSNTSDSLLEEGGFETDSVVYKETGLDKIMDCLTQFKYSIEKLHFSQLLTPTAVGESSTTISLSSLTGAGCSLESIVDSLQQLEELYEATAD